MKVEYDNLIFDSELEVNYYKYLKENNIPFVYQNEYKKKPIKIKIGRRKTYTPDFIVFDDNDKVITIIELKGYSKWSGNEDDNIMDFMDFKVNNDKDFLASWLKDVGVYKDGYDIKYRRLKYLKTYGFVDYKFKNTNTLANRRKEKIKTLTTEVKTLSSELKDVERYFSYLRKKHKINRSQKEWILDFEKKHDLIAVYNKVNAFK